MDFINNNIELIGLISYGLVNILNSITPHWSNAKGITKVILFTTEVLSFFASKGTGNLMKLPGQIQKKN